MIIALTSIQNDTSILKNIIISTGKYDSMRLFGGHFFRRQLTFPQPLSACLWSGQNAVYKLMSSRLLIFWTTYHLRRCSVIKSVYANQQLTSSLFCAKFISKKLGNKSFLIDMGNKNRNHVDPRITTKGMWIPSYNR
jgi:hypothetical protein